MTFIDIATLLIVMVALAAIPSASVALVVARAATLGVANGMAVAAGIVLGDLIFVLFAILGLSVIAETMGGVFLVIRYLGGAYLIWLGLNLLRSVNTEQKSITVRNHTASIVSSFAAGLALTLGDIKAIFFYISFMLLFSFRIQLFTLHLRDFIQENVADDRVNDSNFRPT